MSSAIEKYKGLSWGAMGILLHLHSINAQTFTGAYLQEASSESIETIYEWLTELTLRNLIRRNPGTDSFEYLDRLVEGEARS